MYDKIKSYLKEGIKALICWMQAGSLEPHKFNTRVQREG